MKNRIRFDAVFLFHLTSSLMAKFKRILLKLSGESLMGEKGYGIDENRLGEYADQIKEIADMGVQLGIVIGGGNIFRGLTGSKKGFDRVKGDQMGMLATVINCMAVCDVLKQLGCKAKVTTSINIDGVGERFAADKAIEYMENGTVVLFAGGTGSPFFSTDTAATLRASEVNADVILLAKNVDGVYSADPKKDPSAVRYTEISYEEVLAKRLQVMDSTATSMAMDNNIPCLVFALSEPENIIKALCGENVGTVVG